MSDLKKTVGEIAEKLGIELTYYPENSRPCDAPVCDKQFETVADDGEYTYFTSMTYYIRWRTDRP